MQRRPSFSMLKLRLRLRERGGREEGWGFFSVKDGFYRDVNVSYFLGFPIFSMLVLTHLFLNLKCD